MEKGLEVSSSFHPETTLSESALTSPISALRMKFLSSGKRGTRLRDIIYMPAVKISCAPRS